MNEYAYLLTCDNDYCGYMLVESNCNPEQMQDAIDEKNLRINYSSSEDYPYMTDYEILEEVLTEQGYTCEDVAYI